MQIAHRYAHTGREFHWNVAAEIVALILAAFLVIGLILAIISVWMQQNRNPPALDERPSRSASLLKRDVGQNHEFREYAYGGVGFNS